MVYNLKAMVFPEPFKSYSGYLRQKYGGRVYRVSVDAGFSCPNRGQDRRNAGCTYCDPFGSRAPYLGNQSDLENQVREGISFLKSRYRAGPLILYFQAFSNTYAPVAELERIYDFALGLAPFKELIVSTRPDCIDGEVARLLKGYTKEGLDVWVELGLQSASETTLRRINRRHTVAEYIDAHQLLKREGLNVTTHIIFGLPGELWEDIQKTVTIVASLLPDGIKIHNLHIPEGSAMYREYGRGELTVPSSQRHLEYTISALELLPEQTVIMRLTCDTPRSRLGAPRIFWEKAHFYETLRREMLRRSTFQGRLFLVSGAS
ncbi:MAG TPA: TIGR01212 family radical SAM protein [Spirochaetia bacterium]|nr:TIGR01212 family radical SAM protein [Spirochaetia bacterium]